MDALPREKGKKKAPRMRRLVIHGEETVLSGGINADLFPFLIQVFELHLAVDKGVKGIIPSHSDIVPGMELGPVLTHQDGSGVYILSPVPLDAKPLPLGITAVA
jgi:hypothetical protein